ncbi:GGDEF domain-containing protein [Amphritea balenae]|uniref:diguanylate cyclase n=1 Tax=Amphritea balenae TaxID=452629 RepID=A0A3P1SVC2_9GAMM|nr:GGDEF domain-containing protein [Amphritea balenae]RRD01164.1 GGDEF domain-containing protein [Amphritea balenae]GGK59412.1 hypothetical protein GCM10007941_07050 [Amphritea balenae]
MINTKESDNKSRIQTIVILMISLLVFAAIFVGIRSYEERVAVQAVRLAVEHRVDEVDYELAGQAKNINALWAVYGPQSELTQDEFFSLADPIVESHHTFLPLFISLMGGGLTFVLLGMAMNMSGRTREFHKTIEYKDMELQLSQQKLASVAILDELTGLTNQRHFQQLLDTECRRAVREFSPLTLLLIEVDPKELDQQPEGFAEQQVCQIAELLKKAISRPGDLVARIGEQRFALLLPATNEQSPVLAERLCQQAREIEISGKQLSISIGICTMQPSALLTAEYISEQTLGALNQAIASGRDQVCAQAEGPLEIPVTYSG